MDMHYSQRAYVIREDELPDDIDCLFQQLSYVAPPTALIRRIVELGQTSALVAPVAFPFPGLLQDGPAATDGFEYLLAVLGAEQHERSRLC